MKISYIHSSKKVKTGAGYINNLIVASLRRQALVGNFDLCLISTKK